MLTFGSGSNSVQNGTNIIPKLSILATAYVAGMTNYEKYFTLKYPLPRNSGKTQKFKRWIHMRDLVIANTIYKNAVNAGGDSYVYNPGDNIHALIDKDFYQNFILNEGDIGTEFGQMKKIEQEADVLLIGAWMKVTEELNLYDDMWTLQENIKQYSETFGEIIDGYYRDILYANAGHFINVDDVPSSTAMKNAFKQLSRNLRISGVKPVSEILTSSPNYKTEPVWSRYVAKANPLVVDQLEDNPNWKPLETYAAGIKPLEGERGMLGDMRVTEDFQAPVYEEDDGSGNIVTKGDIIVMGKDFGAHTPLRGKEGIQIITKGFGENGDDPLNRFATLGIKASLGAKVLYPERVGKITVKLA